MEAANRRPEMKRVLPIALLLATFAAPALAQTSMTPGLQNAPARKSPLEGYAGTWIGMFQGHAWITVNLNKQGTELTGTIQRAAQVDFANSGDLKSVSDEKATDSVKKAVLQGDSLLLTVQDTTSQETFHYVMRLTGASIAELKMSEMAMPPGMPKPKPWQLDRVGPTAVAPVR
jgi:hypothetical protein